jgi:hypothetical protein
MCPHTAIYVSSYCYICVLILLYVSSYPALYVSSYCSICVLMLIYVNPHTALYLSSYCSISVLILLYMRLQQRVAGLQGRLLSYMHTSTHFTTNFTTHFTTRRGWLGCRGDCSRAKSMRWLFCPQQSRSARAALRRSALLVQTDSLYQYTSTHTGKKHALALLSAAKSERARRFAQVCFTSTNGLALLVQQYKY